MSDKLTGADVHELLRAIGALGEQDVQWSEHIETPGDPENFAMEAIFVICNSGMKNTVATRIFNKVEQELVDGGRAFEVFKHPGKAAAIDNIWDRRFVLYETFMAQETDDLRLSFLASLPWIGNITKYHLAKNFGDEKPEEKPEEKSEEKPEEKPKEGSANSEKVNVNKAAAKDLVSALELSEKEAESIVQYREKNGNFTNWEDLKKVPDLDSKKIEAKKDQLAF